MTFDIDANGILNVSATDKASGREQHVTITASTNLNKSDIERMVNEAKRNESLDSQRRQLVEARNSADALTYQAENHFVRRGSRPVQPAPDVETMSATRQVMTGEHRGDQRSMPSAAAAVVSAGAQLAGQRPERISAAGIRMRAKCG